jgi:hypothetical protein
MWEVDRAIPQDGAWQTTKMKPAWKLRQCNRFARAEDAGTVRCGVGQSWGTGTA